MERTRKVKFIIMITLMVAIAGMSLGFAAFSATLNVSSSASVTPNSGDFKIEFCEVVNYGFCLEHSNVMWSLDVTATNGAKGNHDATACGLYTNDFEASFTNPNQSVSYGFYVHNLGEYDAYLRGISYVTLDNGSYKKCSASTNDETKATDSLVQAACEGIKVSVNIGGVSYELDKTNISGHLLSKGDVERVIFKIEYLNGSALADGPFNVEIADIKFDYSTVDREVKIINFTIGGYSYQAEEGMTWLEWCNSDYNVDNLYINDSGYVYASSNVMLNDEYVLSSDFISEAANYTFKSSGRPMPSPH